MRRSRPSEPARADVARTIAGLLGERPTSGQAYNLANEETPTLAELVALLARLLGAPLRASSVPADRVLAAGLTPRGVSPFSSAWQSFLDPARAKCELAGSEAVSRTREPR